MGALAEAAVDLAKAFDPEPAYVSYGAFEMTNNGLTGEGKAKESIWICGPFEILGACRDPNGHGWGKWLRWSDADGRQHLRHIEDAALQGEPASLCQTLASDGLKINRDAQRKLAAYLSGAQVEGRVTIVHRTGWHHIGGKSVFVLPEETIGLRGAETVILDTAAHGPYDARGSLQEWQEGVGKLAGGHMLPVLAISAALAGPLLALANQEGGGFISAVSQAGAKRLCSEWLRAFGGRRIVLSAPGAPLQTAWKARRRAHLIRR